MRRSFSYPGCRRFVTDGAVNGAFELVCGDGAVTRPEQGRRGRCNEMRHYSNSKIFRGRGAYATDTKTLKNMVTGSRAEAPARRQKFLSDVSAFQTTNSSYREITRAKRGQEQRAQCMAAGLKCTTPRLRYTLYGGGRKTSAAASDSAAGRQLCIVHFCGCRVSACVPAAC